MSKFANVKKWEESDSESDGEDHKQQPQEGVVGETTEATQEVVEEEVQPSDSESDSEDESDKLNLELVDGGKAEVSKPKKQIPLSKKEKEELRKRELNDLDSLLEQFGLKEDEQPKAEAPVVASQPAAEQATETDDKKKKKKKKTSSNSKSSEVEATVESSESNSAPVDVSAILKSRTAKKPSSKKETVSDAQKIAMAELAKGNDSKKKKKKDLSKFNEFSY